MMHHARWLLGVILCSLLIAGLARAAQTPLRLTVSFPGPRNISYLPLDVAPKIGADRAEGALLEALHTGGGAVALGNLLNRNADFAVAGLPAAMSQRAHGDQVVAIAAVDNAPLFVFMVRTELRGEVKRIADLKGKVIGVNTSSLTSTTTSQQLAELVLRSEGVTPEMVRIVPAGQSWREQSTLIESKGVDAIMGDEPFASRLQQADQVFFLANLADPATSATIPGAAFLHATLETRDDVLTNHPDAVKCMVRILKRTLIWMANHTPEEIVAVLEIKDAEERHSLLYSLKTYPHLYSADGSFSTKQLAETQTFFQATSGNSPTAKALRLESMVVDTWAGRKP